MRKVTKSYLTNRVGADGVTLDILPACEVSKYAHDETLSSKGYRYAEYHNTGAVIMVKSMGNRRFVKSWGRFVTDFEVYEMDVVVIDGAIWESVGKKKSLKLFCDADFAAIS